LRRAAARSGPEGAPKSAPDFGARPRRLRDSLPRYISGPMKRVFDMDDRARLPWRFYGATMTVLARL